MLSLDIDGNDYWIWKEIKSIQPIIFICEFNAVLGDLISLSTPYIKNFDRTKFHYSNLAFGASLNAFKYISEKKGYIFLGTNSNGVNAYFIRKEYYKFVRWKIRDKKSFCSKIRESRNKKNEKTFFNKIDRLNKIKNLNLINVKNNTKVKLKDFKKIYSAGWKKSM